MEDAQLDESLTPPTDAALAGSAERLMEHVHAMAGVGSRFWRAPGYETAMRYAEERFRQWGYTTRRQPFTVKGMTTSENLIVDPPGAEDRPPRRLLCAHLDSFAKHAKEGGAAPGADDNASGCALVLETARRLAEHGAPGDLRFGLFGAEELGMIGSAHTVAQLSRADRDALTEVWVLDQIGRDTRPQPTLKLEGRAGLSDPLTARAEVAAPEAGLLTVRAEYEPYGSDHMSFLDAMLPTLLLIQPDDEDDPMNHTAGDTPDRLDPLYMARVLALLLRLLSPA